MANRKKKLSHAELDREIRAIQLLCKPKPGEKPFAEWWAEYKREELKLEEAKFLRMERAGLLPLKRNSTRLKKKSTI